MRRWAAWWAIGGVLLTLVEAVVRLGQLAVAAIPEMNAVSHFVLLAVWVPLIVYCEGHRAFHQRFCPLAVSRASVVSQQGRPWLVAIAPLFAMGLVHANRRRLIISWAVVGGVVALVLAIEQFPQPWRGIVDAGVALALAYGTVSLLWHARRLRSGEAIEVDPELPEPSTVCSVESIRA